MREPLIELDGVSLAFGEHRVLDGLSLAVYRGETTVILGRSGSGKTVLLKLMLGLVAPDRGTVRVFGKDLATLSPVELLALRTRTSMLFQSYALFDGMSVADNVMFPLRESPASLSDAEIHARAAALLEQLGLTGADALLPGELSGGMRKRVSLARALVTRPELVFFDEPTTGLDPLMVEKVDAMLARAKQQYGITSVIVSHDLASIQRLADRVLFLHDGAIAFTGTFSELERCDVPAVRAFLDPLVTAHGEVSPESRATPAVELAGVHKRFGSKHVLRGIDLVVAPRRITALIGASGSGKSVMVKIILGLMPVDAGTVRVLGEDVASRSDVELEALRRRCGLVFQHAALLDWLDVEGNIAFPLRERPHEPDVPARVDAILDQLALTDLRHRMPGQLSTGERKRVALARAMVTRPELLIYDEPTTGQDPQRTHEIDHLIVEMHQRHDMATLVISHDLESMFRIADTIAMLHEGRIVAIGTPAELRASADEHVRRFLAASELAH